MFRKNRQANVDFEQKIKYSGYSDKPIIRIGSYLWAGRVRRSAAVETRHDGVSRLHAGESSFRY